MEKSVNLGLVYAELIRLVNNVEEWWNFENWKGSFHFATVNDSLWKYFYGSLEKKYVNKAGKHKTASANQVRNLIPSNYFHFTELIPFWIFAAFFYIQIETLFYYFINWKYAY